MTSSRAGSETGCRWPALVFVRVGLGEHLYQGGGRRTSSRAGSRTECRWPCLVFMRVTLGQHLYRVAQSFSAPSAVYGMLASLWQALGQPARAAVV